MFLEERKGFVLQNGILLLLSPSINVNYAHTLMSIFVENMGLKMIRLTLLVMPWHFTSMTVTWKNQLWILWRELRWYCVSFSRVILALPVRCSIQKILPSCQIILEIRSNNSIFPQNQLSVSFSNYTQIIQNFLK